MMTPLHLVQAFIAIAMLDVWLFRYNRPLRARGGDAQTMVEEFRVYGLPDWFRNLVRALKLGCAALLLVGLAYGPAALVGGSVLVALMAGAVAMHLKVRDPWLKSVPATFFLLLSAFVAYGHWPATAG
jgi:hypothetical protein